MHLQQLLKRTIIAAFLSLCFAGISHAQAPSCTTATCNATTCNRNDVLNAWPTSGNTNPTVVVNIPAGTCVWTTTISVTQPAAVTSLTVIGAGNLLCPASCDDATTINDQTPHTGGDIGAINITTSAGATLSRFSGITFTYSSGSNTFHGTMQYAGSSKNIRWDHNHFKFITAVVCTLDGPMEGVIDHNFFQMVNPSTNNGCKIQGDSGGHLGDVEWSQATQFGTIHFIFFEDNVFSGGVPEDCRFGGRFVARHNTLTWPVTGSPAGGGWQGHATGSAGNDGRSCRAFESYLNTFTGQSSNPNFTSEFSDGGPQLTWGNTIVGMQHNLYFVNDRGNNGTYTQSATPAGWGYCGTNFNGTGSNWDQNVAPTNGYACIDQVGRGIGDLLTGVPPTKVNSTTGTIAWPNQAREPDYSWLENWTTPSGGSGNGFLGVIDPAGGTIVNNRDFYFQCDANNPTCPGVFNGSVGVGTGPFAARPLACTAGPGSTPGVGFWDTTNSILWVCTVTGNPGTWTNYYTPFTYPHPLVSGMALVATPTFSPAAGAYPQTQNITLSDSTGGATICYTTDGSTPTANGAGTCTAGTTYSGAFVVAFTVTVKAIGSESGFTDSSVGTATYTITPISPSKVTFAAITGQVSMSGGHR